MIKYIALLRGINVGGNKLIKQAKALNPELFESKKKAGQHSLARPSDFTI